MRLVIF